MLEIKCPACHGMGRVPRFKVGVRLVCRKCHNVFHLTPSLHPVLGEPPVSKDAPKARAANEEGYELTDALEAFGEKFSKFKLPSGRTLGIGAGVLLVGALAYLLFSHQSLETRARMVAAGIESSDMKQVIDLTLPGTENEVIMWYAGVYKQYLDVKLMVGMTPAVRIQGTGSRQGGSAMVIAVFSRPGSRPENPAIADSLQPIPSLSNTKDTLEVPLFFVQDALGNWLLDGKRTSIGVQSPAA